MSILLSLDIDQWRNAFGTHSFGIWLMILAVFLDLKIIVQAHKAICALLLLGMIDAVMIVELYKLIKGNMLYVLALDIKAIDAFLVLCMITFSFDVFLNIFLLSFWLTQWTMAVLTMLTLL